jgi:hypothetical protein
MTAVAQARPSLAPLLAVFALLLLAAALTAYFAIARSAAMSHAANDAAPAKVATIETSGTPWFLPEPSPRRVGQATNRPAQSKAATKSEPDWSAFSLGVSSAEASIAPSRSGNEASSPAELTVALSKDERSRLMAAAKDAEDGVAPVNYRPLIGQLYPAGGGDGICR